MRQRGQADEEAEQSGPDQAPYWLCHLPEAIETQAEQPMEN